MANNIINNKWGIFCYQVSNITISGNILSNNSGASISGFNSEQIQIYGNTLSNNNITVCFTYCQNSNVYGNNFINNTSTSVDPESNSGLNFGWSTINWNNNRLGNFWSNYEGADANKDGIGDTPYVIDEKNQDNYPLMYPYGIEKDTIAFSEPFPTFVIAAFVIVAVIVVAGLLVYYKKHKTVN
jgi:parallel beta-helix repeat protein